MLSVKSQALRLEHGAEHRRKIGRKAGSHRYTSCATFHAVPSLTDDRQRQGWHAAKFRMFVWLGVGRATESPPNKQKGAHQVRCTHKHIFRMNWIQKNVT